MTTNANCEKRPFLVFGLVGAIGCDLGKIQNALSSELESYGYEVRTVSVAGEIISKSKAIKKMKLTKEAFNYYYLYQTYGNYARRFAFDWWIGEIIKKIGEEPPPGKAVIVKSLKTPEEIKKLQEKYKRHYFTISCFLPRDERKKTLVERLKKAGDRDSTEEKVDCLVRRDYDEERWRKDDFKSITAGLPEQGKKFEQKLEDEQAEGPTDYLQNVKEAYELADLYLTHDGGYGCSSAPEIKRFIEILGGHPFHTPTREEYFMHLAYAASLRSSDLGRQVGAVITDSYGEVLSIGCNEVPKVGGGIGSCEDCCCLDRRDFHKGQNAYVEGLERIVREIANALQDKGGEQTNEKRTLLSEHIHNLIDCPAINRLMLENLKDTTNYLKKKTVLGSVTDFFRPLHGEMAAILAAARKGVSIRNATMYVTAFPCHTCMKHIIGAGITNVVFLDAYEKSLAKDLFGDQFSIGSKAEANKVHVKPYEGVSPRGYDALFLAIDRKDKHGNPLEWKAKEADFTVRLRDKLKSGEPKKRFIGALWRLIASRALRFF
jgi:cytidine deaminase